MLVASSAVQVSLLERSQSSSRYFFFATVEIWTSVDLGCQVLVKGSVRLEFLLAIDALKACGVSICALVCFEVFSVVKHNIVLFTIAVLSLMLMSEKSVACILLAFGKEHLLAGRTCWVCTIDVLLKTVLTFEHFLAGAASIQRWMLVLDTTMAQLLAIELLGAEVASERRLVFINTMLLASLFRGERLAANVAFSRPRVYATKRLAFVTDVLS